MAITSPMPYVASTALDETEATVGPAVLIVNGLLVETNAPPAESVILFAPCVYDKRSVVSAANALVTVKVAESPLSATTTFVTVFSVPSTVTEKSLAAGVPDTASEKPITTLVPPSPAFWDVIVGRTSSIEIELLALLADAGSGRTKTPSLPALSSIVPDPTKAKLSVPA